VDDVVMVIIGIWVNVKGKLIPPYVLADSYKEPHAFHVPDAKISLLQHSATPEFHFLHVHPLVIPSETI
jgi:hypothetical protein